MGGDHAPLPGAQATDSLYACGRRWASESVGSARPRQRIDRSGARGRSDVSVTCVGTQIRPVSIEWGISYRDALIIRAAGRAGCDRVLSEDLRHGRTYGSVTAENPFR